MVTFNLSVILDPLVVELGCLFQTFADHSFNLLWWDWGHHVFHQDLQDPSQRECVTSSCWLTVRSVKGFFFFLQTLSSRDKVALSAPSGRPKGKQYLHGKAWNQYVITAATLQCASQPATR